MSKNETVHFRLTEAERQRLEKMAEECELTLSELIRILLSKRHVALVDADASLDGAIRAAVMG